MAHVWRCWIVRIGLGLTRSSLAAVITVVVAYVPAVPAQATVSGENGVIAFASDPDSDFFWDIYTIEPNGSGLTRLTDDPGSEESPAWSPDGRRIVFVRDTGTGPSIVVMDADGSKQQVLAQAPLGGSNPTWSPDGTSIAFDSVRHGGPADIYVMNADGSNQRRLTTTTTTDWGPEWSPDGRHIAFTRGTADASVYVMRSDGSDQTEFAEGGAPSWAPDGLGIAVANRHVWLHPTDGASGPVPLAVDVGADFGDSPAWSPDGTVIAVADQSSGLELWSRDGSTSTPLTAQPQDRDPAWQPVNPYPVGLVDTTTGIWRLRDATGVVDSFYYGVPGDLPFMGDWDCDGIDNPGLYRRSDGFVYLRNRNTQGIADVSFFFGNPGDIPIAGDFDGDGCDTVSVYRPSQSRVFIINTLGSDGGGLGAAEIDYLFGNPGDTPFVGDFDGDGTDTIGLHRAGTGLVYYRNTHTQGIADDQFLFGNPGDRFATNDWNHDGIDTPMVFRPSNTTHYFRFSNTQGAADARYIWGNPRWWPVTGVFRDG